MRNTEFVHYPQRNRINTVSKVSLEEIEIQIDAMGINNEIFDSNFKIYKFSDFNIINYEKSFEGVYGKVIHGIHTDTSQDMIIKKYPNSLQFGIFESIIKEIALFSTRIYDSHIKRRFF